MGNSKSAKRKRNAQAQAANKLTKTGHGSLPSPPDGSSPARAAAAFEPKSLASVISDEELEITVETLQTLAKYPSLTKAKMCKDLRAAVYDFRQSCTTGVNSAEGANLTARVTAAITDEKYLDAKILLAEMRLRGEEPKLGALCRWVRDLDVVTRPLGVNFDDAERTHKEKELVDVLDAVLRVSCTVDTNVGAHQPGAPRHFAFQQTWDMRSSTASLPIWASVQDKSILSYAPKNPDTALRILETIPGAQRKPPNEHPAILYATSPNAVALSPEPRDITYHKHPHVPNLGIALNALSADECRSIIAAGESVGFLPDTPIREGGDNSVLAHNFYWIVDTEFHDLLWKRMAPLVPASVGGKIARGVNRRFRVYRYVPGAEYRCHIDGAWPPSGILPDDSYVYDSSPKEKKQSSLFTFLLYLNDEFEGGETTFFLPGATEGTLNAYPVRPVMGAIAVFPHGETKGALLHEGTSVTKGAKYIIRTDIEYDVDPTEAA